MTSGSVEEARTRTIRSSMVCMSSLVQYTLLPVSRSNDSMVTFAGLAAKVAKSKGRNPPESPASS